MRIVVVALPLVIVIVGIVVLAHQNIKETGDTAYRVEQIFMRIVPPTGKGSIGEPTWCGLTIRRLAHIAEYALLGLAASLVAMYVLGVGMRPALYTLAFCLVASLADELQKILIPGRHFDVEDLALDALSYIPVVTLAFALAALLGA